MPSDSGQEPTTETPSPIPVYWHTCSHPVTRWQYQGLVEAVSRYQDMTRICQEMPVSSNKSTNDKMKARHRQAWYKVHIVHYTFHNVCLFVHFVHGLHKRKGVLLQFNAVWSQLKALATVKCSSSLKSETRKGWMLSIGFHIFFPLFLRGDFQNGQARLPIFTCSHKSHKSWGPGPTRLVGTFAFGVTGTGTASGCYVLLAMLCGFSVLCVVVAVGFMLAVPGKFASILTHYTLKKWSKVCGILCRISPERAMRKWSPKRAAWWCLVYKVPETINLIGSEKKTHVLHIGIVLDSHWTSGRINCCHQRFWGVMGTVDGSEIQH